MAWVPEPISLEKLDPSRGSSGSQRLAITGYGRGFRPQTTVQLRNGQGVELQISNLKVASPNRFGFTVALDGPVGTYSAVVTNPPSEGTAPEDNAYTLVDAFTLEA